ncbi:MAG: amidohydrolase family protein [Oscillospiraceae bacterium]|nr:amidohydrolase family protein [Oscillospiraceae bacterium]
MLLDFHIHVFPEKVAQKAIPRLAATCGQTPLTDGTLPDTLRLMERDGVDAGVFLNIATRPSQQRTINESCLAMRSSRVIPFGSVHPDAPDAVEELEWLQAHGVPGVKLHPDYQEFFVEEERLRPIYEACQRLGLILVLHAGWDPLSPDCIHCRPEPCARILDEFPGLTLVLAHLGGMALWDDVERFLVGKKVYFDTACMEDKISPERFARIIRAHGAGQILFASDCPWGSPRRLAELIRSLGLSPLEEEQILWKNACALLGLPQ